MCEEVLAVLHTADAIEVQMGRRVLHTHTTHLASMIDITISRHCIPHGHCIQYDYDVTHSQPVYSQFTQI